jgi:hypothetical protein
MKPHLRNQSFFNEVMSQDKQSVSIYHQLDNKSKLQKEEKGPMSKNVRELNEGGGRYCQQYLSERINIEDANQESTCSFLVTCRRVFN